jgi:hypothetical protein
VQTSSIDALKGRFHGLSPNQLACQRQADLLNVLKNHANFTHLPPSLCLPSTGQRSSPDLAL